MYAIFDWLQRWDWGRLWNSMGIFWEYEFRSYAFIQQRIFKYHIWSQALNYIILNFRGNYNYIHLIYTLLMFLFSNRYQGGALAICKNLVCNNHDALVVRLSLNKIWSPERQSQLLVTFYGYFNSLSWKNVYMSMNACI